MSLKAAPDEPKVEHWTKRFNLVQVIVAVVMTAGTAVFASGMTWQGLGDQRIQDNLSTVHRFEKNENKIAEVEARTKAIEDDRIKKIEIFNDLKADVRETKNDVAWIRKWMEKAR